MTANEFLKFVREEYNKKQDSENVHIYKTDAQKEFLFKEYESAVELTYHIDEMRNKLTSFYLIFTGAAGGGLLLLLKNETKEVLQPQTVYFLSGLFLLLVSIIGTFVICGLGRLRMVQIEYFGIIYRIRKVFFGQNESEGLWDVVNLPHDRLPTPKMTSGTYMWLMMVVLTGASIFGVSTCLLLIYFPTAFLIVRNSRSDR